MAFQYWQFISKEKSIFTVYLSIYLFSSGFEGDALLAQAAIFFVAGRETSITTMTCVLFELAKQPEMQRRVREEILKTIQDANDVTYEAVHNMKYLHQVINETLRLYPPAPIIDRFPLRDYTVRHSIHYISEIVFTLNKKFFNKRFFNQFEIEIQKCLELKYEL